MAPPNDAASNAIIQPHYPLSTKKKDEIPRALALDLCFIRKTG